MQVEYVVERIGMQMAVARRVNGVKLGEEVTEQQIIWPQVAESGTLIDFGTLIEDAIREAVEQAEEREGGG